ncbi:hypothetical protein GH714_020493 [Hevea brasiliensis]|uniref:Uncharacterized protein n=1 Tax=Hevea brasiliensis TaxID=3981 RepID=A0A6A6MJJ0_HEVBR|nr:hypothetical protein GH714_020493 [Hevea brasiliensis]
MASKLGACSRATSRSAHFQETGKLLFLPLEQSLFADKSRTRIIGRSRIRTSNDGNSYLDMWNNAVDLDTNIEFQKLNETVFGIDNGDDADNDGGQRVNLKKKSVDFKKILMFPRRRRTGFNECRSLIGLQQRLRLFVPFLVRGAPNNESIFVSRSETSGKGVPGPDFWSWIPPPDTEKSQYDVDLLAAKRSLTSYSSFAVTDGGKKEEVSISGLDMPSLKEEEHKLNLVFQAHELEVALVLDEVDEEFSGVDPNGSRWWKESGIERRPDGVICRWTMTRGASANQDVEWQEKFWEASDEFGYKELGSEKSGRDATGNVWREYWREAMWQESGLMHLEKTADKWGKNGRDDEWKEESLEHYDASNQTEKWAHKWCTVDPTTQLEAGHAHVWHERWAEKYDGNGGTIKYTDKWAERCEGDIWTKWGKWDEHFDPNGHGVKQGETWWEGKHGERWNRTWGERHNGSGWIHKYGRSSSGSTGTHMWSRRHGMRDSHNSVSITALITQSSSGMFQSHL